MDIEELRKIVDSVISMTCYNADREDARDIPEFIAYEIIDLIEIKTQYDLQKDIASIVLHKMPAEYIPSGTSNYIKRHFNLCV